MTTQQAKQNSRQRLTQLLCGDELTLDDYRHVALMEQARLEGLDGMLLPLFLKHREWPLDEQVFASFALNVRERKAHYLRRQHALRQVLSALQAAGVPVICVRGMAVTETLYGDKAYLRPQSDVDLLFDDELMLSAKQALWDIGYRPDQVYRNIYFRGDIALDLHSDPLGVERMHTWQYLTPLTRKHFFAMAEQGELLGVPALMLPAGIHLPYLCFHALKHSFERLTWLNDIALLARDIDGKHQWDEVLAGIDAFALQRPCFFALSYVAQYLQAPVPDRVLEKIRPNMGIIERGLFTRFMAHETIPYLAERLFARMQPDLKHRLAFWKETIYPRYEVRQQIAGSGCVKCNFIRKRLKQLAAAAWMFCREGGLLFRYWRA